MGLHVYYSDRIEDLALHLKSELLRRRSQGGDPFETVAIGVPNTNIAKWLQMRVFAKEKGLCAGLEFPFMEKLLTNLMRESLPEGENGELLPEHAYAVAIAGMLMESDAPELAPFRTYFEQPQGDGGAGNVLSRRQSSMAWQLADKLASLMDEYEVRRPEIVSNWLNGLNVSGLQPPEPGSVEAGEAFIANALWGEQGRFPLSGQRLSMRQFYDRVKDTAPRGPSRTLYLFGHSTLSLLQARILVWLAQIHEVVFYHNNVCLEYWGDIETDLERRKRLGTEQSALEDIKCENPLLQKWGTAGRETMRLLVELEEACDGCFGFEWKCIVDENRPAPATVLTRVQEAICHRQSPTPEGPQDASIQIVGTPGMRREVEMVYNSIIGSVWMPDGSGERPWPECRFSDIAVLVPDMKTYRPVIEAVFDARGDVPYGLIDTTSSEDSKYLAGFLSLMEFARNGLNRRTLFAVLDNPCVQLALGVSQNDVDDWRRLTAEKLGAFDDFEQQGDGANFQWAWALKRLRLGRVASGTLQLADGVTMPLVAEGDDNALRFSEIVEWLARELAAVAYMDDGRTLRRLPCATRSQGERSWLEVLGQVMDHFLAVPNSDILEDNVRRKILQVIGMLQEITAPQGFEFVVAAIELFAGTVACRKGGYLTHGVTIAGLMPMRPVPFRQVYVLGMGEGGFPGRDTQSTLDIRGGRWRLGDTSFPKINRYLFLETLMAVRDRLVISYPNLDIEKDAELFPNGLIRELEEFISTSIIASSDGERGGFREFPRYPLLERGEMMAVIDAESYKSPVDKVIWHRDDPHAGILPTYSPQVRQMAAAHAAAINAAAPPLEAVVEGAAAPPASQVLEISAKCLGDFLMSPLDAVLRYRFGIRRKGEQNDELETDSPLDIASRLLVWKLNDRWLNSQYIAIEDVTEEEQGEASPLPTEDWTVLFGNLQQAGKLPKGFLGNYEERKFEGKLAKLSTSKDFVASFLEGASPYLQHVLLDLSMEDGTTCRVRLTAEQPYWKEQDNVVQVLETKAIDPINPRPRGNVTAAFMAFLMHLASPENIGGEPKSLRLGVVDIDGAKWSCWTWNAIGRETAIAYLQRLCRTYLEFFSVDCFPDVDYELFRKALKDNGLPIDAKEVQEFWRKVAAARAQEATQDEASFMQKNADFDANLAVEKSVRRFLRPPTREELQNLYESVYALPLSGGIEAEEGGK